eukprot:m.107445 g.107445  ORF g.107445 m.107445 type:complete len:272 (-) comp16926_c1_seq1:142-957(-)
MAEFSVEEHDAWKAERLDALMSEEGYLAITHLHFLNEGDNTFGSASHNDMVLPDGPEDAGKFVLKERQVTVTPAEGKTLLIDNVEVANAKEVYPPKEDRHMIGVGRVKFFVHYSGERIAIRVFDPKNDLRVNFAGIKQFPVDERFCVRAHYVTGASETVMLPNVHGDSEPFEVAGELSFMLLGTEYTLRPVLEDRLWFIYKDLTSGKETYGAGRFLYVDMPDEHGWTTIDFNKSYNPACAFNPHTTCPMPPKGNKLNLRVEAGEMMYDGSH